jgi:hypothetical protein
MQNTVLSSYCPNKACISRDNTISIWDNMCYNTIAAQTLPCHSCSSGSIHLLIRDLIGYTTRNHNSFGPMNRYGEVRNPTWPSLSLDASGSSPPATSFRESASPGRVEPFSLYPASSRPSHFLPSDEQDFYHLSDTWEAATWVLSNMKNQGFLPALIPGFDTRL